MKPDEHRTAPRVEGEDVVRVAGHGLSNDHRQNIIIIIVIDLVCVTVTIIVIVTLPLLTVVLELKMIKPRGITTIIITTTIIIIFISASSTKPGRVCWSCNR